MKENKRVLIITYYWPPSAGSGVQRWLKFVKYLPDFGWDPVVFTPENPDFELKDTSLLKEVSKNVEVLKFPIWEPYKLLRKVKTEKIKDPGVIIEKKKKSLIDKLAIWIRANFVVPDPRVYWVKPSVKYLSDITERNNFDAVITTGPPHSVHLIGRNLKRKTNITWIADFRDPWSSWEFLDTLPMLSVIRKWHRKLEQSVLKEADAVVTISPTFQEEISEIAKREVYLITNGFDGEDLPSDFFTPTMGKEYFHIVYTGIIDAIRDPVPFLKAFQLAFAIKNIPVKLTFVGKVSEQVREFIQKEAWLSSHVHLAGYVSHTEVFDFYKSADLLLLILTNTKNAKGNIPGKLFEYIATGREIVALGDPGGDSAKIIQEAGAGKVFLHEDVKGIRNYLEEQYKTKLNLKFYQAGEGKYERKMLTKELAKLIHEKVDPLS